MFLFGVRLRTRLGDAFGVLFGRFWGSFGSLLGDFGVTFGRLLVNFRNFMVVFGTFLKVSPKVPERLQPDSQKRPNSFILGAQRSLFKGFWLLLAPIGSYWLLLAPIGSYWLLLAPMVRFVMIYLYFSKILNALPVHLLRRVLVDF